MIYFSTKPDAFFSQILDAALEWTRDDVRESMYYRDTRGWELSFPMASRCFSPGTAFPVIEELLGASRAPEVYRVTDYHWLLLYESLWNFCELFNDEARDEPGKLCWLDPGAVREIDFVALVEMYFWDTDFLFTSKIVENLGRENRESLGISDEAFGIAQGWEPHSAELRMELVADPDWVGVEEHFNPSSRRYPS